jgi:microtubule-associated protein-like 6
MSFRAERSRSPRSNSRDRGRGRGDRSRSPRSGGGRGRSGRSERNKKSSGKRKGKRRGNKKRDKDGIYWYQDCTERVSHRRRKAQQEKSNESTTSNNGGGSKNNNNNRVGETKNSNDDNRPITGDDHIDQEGKVPDRSDKYHEQMSQAGYSTSGTGDAQDGVGDVFGTLETPKKKKKHRMERKAWNTVASKGAPDGARDASNKPIGSTLYLEHVHGFRGQNVRNNLYYAADGTMVYIAAALGICVDPKTRQQRYMGGHTDDIISMALTNDNDRFSYVATGEIGRNPKIIVWKSNTMEIVSTIKDCHKRGISRVAFSPNGSILASVGIDDQNSLALHNWKSGDLLGNVQRTGGDKVFGLVFHPTDNNQLVTCGHNHMTFWTKTDQGLNDKNAIFGTNSKISVLDTCYDKSGRCFAGTSLGHLCVFAATGKSKKMLGFGQGSVENAHEGGPINCVEVVPGGNHIISGGKDGKIRVWDCSSNNAITMVNEFKFPAQIPSVQSLSVLGALDDSTCKALVGTRGGDVLEISLSNGKRLKNKPVVTGHNYGELWGLVVHPSNPNIFVTSGDDKSVRMWNISDQECVAMAKPDALPDMSRCLAYTQDAKFLACGCGGRLGGRKVGDMGKHAGKVVILDGTSLRHLATFKVAKEQIADICYSNDGKTLV